MDNEQWTGYLPTTTPETEPFWAAANDGVLLLQQCADCGKVQYHYRALCSFCMSDHVEDLPSTGQGTVWTFTVVYRNNSVGYSERTPYVIALVELEGGVRVLSNVVTDNPERVTFGTRVVPTFVTARNGQAIPLFKTVDA